MKRPHVVRLSGPAARFLQVLQDFGHLDDDQAARVVLSLVPNRKGEAVAGVDAVRRAAAVQLFERSGGDPDGLLADDWPLLFS